MARVLKGIFARRREVDLIIHCLVQDFSLPKDQAQFRVTVGDPRVTGSGEGDAQHPAIKQSERQSNFNDTLELGVRPGEIVLTAWVDENDVDRALALFKRFGVIRSVVN